jgi:hypothetical protein
MSDLGPESLRELAIAKPPFVWRKSDGHSMVSVSGVEINEHADAWATERKQARQFIRDMYTGRFAKRAQDYWTLPQWIRDAIEADPIYHEEPE